MNASHSHGDHHLSGAEIAHAISTVSTLAAEVIKHSDHLQPVEGTAYQPRGMTPRFLSVRKEFLSNITGYAFGDDDNPRLITEHLDKVLIATRYEFPRRRHNLYALNTPSDFVSVWVAEVGFISGGEARRAISKVLFQMGQLLPDGHPMKRIFIDENPVGEYAGSSLER
jgi:hypothetical protein